MRRILALGFFTVALVVMPAASPAFACDCGGLVPPPNNEATIAGERAILSLDDGVQTTQLLLGTASTSASAGLIIPTPSPATVSLGELDDFDAIETAMLPRPSYVEDWWGVHALVAAARNENPEIPRVIDHVELGPLEATTLAASDASGLLKWLRTNDFALPSGATALLKPYVTAGWSFVAIKLSSDVELTGTLDPIQLSFESDTLVYPARLFQGYTEPHSLRLYVVDDSRVDLVKSANAAVPQPINAAQKVVWAANLREGEPHAGKFLTVFDVRFDTPETQATSDIYFAESKANDEVVSTVTVVRPMTLLGVPFGTVLVGTGVIALLALAGFFIARMRVR
jgi:hypothetical protein